MFGIGEKNKKPNIKNTYNIVFDIRNSSVAIGVLEKNKFFTKIIYTKRKYISLHEDQGGKEFMKKSFRLLDELIQELHKQNEFKDIVKKIDKVLCVFAAPWYETKIENFITKEEKKTLFTKSFLNKKIKITEDKDSNKEAIENQLLSVKLNGYEVNDPFKKTFNEAKISFYKGVIDSKVKKYLENKIKDNFKVKKVDFHTHAFVLLMVLKTHFHSNNNFCLFDIGSKITEVSIFKNGVYQKIISIPRGFNNLVDKQTESDGSTKQNSISKIKLISQGNTIGEKAQDEMIESIKDIFIQISENKSEFTEEDDSISNTIFITTDKDFEEPFLKAFKNRKVYNGILGLNIEPTVRVINSRTTHGLAEYNSDIERDPLISIISNFSTIDF